MWSCYNSGKRQNRLLEIYKLFFHLVSWTLVSWFSVLKIGGKSLRNLYISYMCMQKFSIIVAVHWKVVLKKNNQKYVDFKLWLTVFSKAQITLLTHTRSAPNVSYLHLFHSMIQGVLLWLNNATPSDKPWIHFRNGL